MNGSTLTSAPAARTKYVTPRPTVRRGDAAPERLLIHHSSARKLILDERQEQNDGEQNERKRSGVAVAIGLVQLLEDEHARGRRRVARATLGHDPDVVEGLERANHRENQQEERRRRQQ